MKVYLLSDYLKSFRGEPLSASQVICEISAIERIPDCLVSIKGKIARVCMIEVGKLFIEYKKTLPKDDNIYCSDNITCPQCGSADLDSLDAADSDNECECADCGSLFSYERHVEVTYTSKIVKRNDTILTLK